MNKIRKLIFVLIMLIVIAIAGITVIAISVSKQEQDYKVNTNGTTRIVTSFYPMYIACMNICENADVEIVNLSEPETGCLHDYQLTTEDMKLLATADIFVVNGGGIEEFLKDVVEAYPNLKIVDASQGIELHDGNSHVWMSVNKHIDQIKNIVLGLKMYDKKNSDLYQSNGDNYIEKLKVLLSKITDNNKNENVVLFSEAYEYVADEYGFNVVGMLDLDEEKEVSAKELADTIEVVKNNDVGIIIAEKEYGEKMAQMVSKEVPVNVIYLDTIIRGEYNKDSYLARMDRNLDLVQEAFTK